MPDFDSILDESFTIMNEDMNNIPSSNVSSSCSLRNTCHNHDSLGPCDIEASISSTTTSCSDRSISTRSTGGTNAGASRNAASTTIATVMADSIWIVPQDDISVLPPTTSHFNHAHYPSRFQRVQQTFLHIYTTNFVTDQVCYFGQVALFESVAAVRVFKFIVLTLWIITFYHTLIRSKLFQPWEKDVDFDSNQWLQVDFSKVIVDCLAFAFVARVHRKKGIDRLQILIPILVSCFYSSLSGQISYLKYHISVQNIMDEWPWQMTLYFILCVGVFLMLLVLHLSKAILDRSYMWRSIETISIVTAFVLVKVDHDSFHLHHYYYAWTMGMFFNRSDWWSELSMAFCWGIYCNGIATYGRDPVVVV